MGTSSAALSQNIGLQEAGGMMTLTDAFVRVNRARGLELVSPGTANRVAVILVTYSKHQVVIYNFMCFRQCVLQS